jgi:hypothetical protein
MHVIGLQPPTPVGQVRIQHQPKSMEEIALTNAVLAHDHCWRRERINRDIGKIAEILNTDPV